MVLKEGVNLLGGSWLKLNIFKVSATRNVKCFPLQPFILYICCMIWYLKLWTLITSSILFNKTSLCSKVWFIGFGFFLFNNEDNYIVTQGWKNLKFLCTYFFVPSWKLCCMHVHQKNVLLVRLCSWIMFYVV